VHLIFRILTHFILFLASLGFVAAQTQLSGIVLDSATLDPLPYVTIQTGSGKSGVRTDINGHFYLAVNEPITSIKVSYVGFQSQIVQVSADMRNDLRILLQEAQSTIKEVRIKPQKYQKDLAAIDLVAKVFEHKDLNRKEGLDYYQFEKHEKLRFDLNGITDKYRKKWYFKKFRFAFGYCDTNLVSQKVALPFYFRERILQTFYRNGKADSTGVRKSDRKEKIIGERQTAFDDGYDVDQDGISAFLNVMYQDVDIYEPTLTLLDKQFVGPLSGGATNFYRFFIIDTIKIGTEQFADVFFAPKNKNDLAFMGNMLVALDGSYAVRRVEMGISKDMNINWVSDLRIEQEFTFQEDSTARRLMLSGERVVIDLKILKNRSGRSILATKTAQYNDFQLNRPLPDSLFSGQQVVLKDTGDIKTRTDTFWVERRQEQLTKTENGVTAMIDSIKATRLYKFAFNFIQLGATGYQRIGPVDLGEVADLYSFNDLEGDRVQLTLRTNDRYFKKSRYKVYTAYGIGDRTPKAGGSATFAFKNSRPARFPANQLRISYVQDLFFPGASSRGSQGLLNSLQRGSTGRLLNNQISRADYAREFISGFSFSIHGQHRLVREVGFDDEGVPIPSTTTTATEFGTWIRYAPNERFYQARESRVNFNNKWPVFYLQYRASVKGVLGGDYSFQRTSLRCDKIFYLGAAGRMRSSLEYNKIFGTLSYTFLDIARANQTYFFDDLSYALMNYLEFISDQNLSLRLNYDLEGLLLNRIPLIKKLHWREGFTLKFLYGDLAQRNIPTASNGLLPFPTATNGTPLTKPLSKMPYAEASVGVGNIFNMFRLDYVWRLTYRNEPGVQLHGPRLSFGLSF
jgi:hypothetical protein